MPRRRTPCTDDAQQQPTTLHVYQGDDKRWLFKLKKRDGTPFPLDGYTAAMQFRTAYADEAVDDAVDLEAEVVDATAGEVGVILSSEQSALLTEDQYLWDLEITDTAGSWTTTIAGGDVLVKKEVTRLAGP